MLAIDGLLSVRVDLCDPLNNSHRRPSCQVLALKNLIAYLHAIRG